MKLTEKNKEGKKIVESSVNSQDTVYLSCSWGVVPETNTGKEKAKGDKMVLWKEKIYFTLTLPDFL